MGMTLAVFHLAGTTLRLALTLNTGSNEGIIAVLASIKSLGTTSSGPEEVLDFYSAKAREPSVRLILEIVGIIVSI